MRLPSLVVTTTIRLSAHRRRVLLEKPCDATLGVSSPAGPFRELSGSQSKRNPSREGPRVRSAAGWPLSKRREAARSDFREPFLAGPRQSPQHALRGSVSACRNRGGVSAHPGRSRRRRPQSGDSHSRLHRRKLQDPSPILSLRNLAAGERTAPKACACDPGPEGNTFAHSGGCSTKAPGCIGARGLRDGCAGLLPPPWS